MLRVRIVHWKAEEAEPLLNACRKAGFNVEFDDGDLPVVFRAVRDTIPDVLVIDLSRRPSSGRELAIAIRGRKYMRHIPIVFVDGDPVKVEALRGWLPDATFVPLKKVVAGIRTAYKNRTPDPVSPPTVMQRYGSRTNAQKLGVKEGTAVGLFDPPSNYFSVIGELPAGVELVEEPEEIHPVTLWFVTDPRDYQDGLRAKGRMAGKTRLWVVWRKGSTNGLTQDLVRESANEVGLVDYKICALDQHWSAMAFAVRRK
jgi:CheY-like chemotaxis protein